MKLANKSNAKDVFWINIHLDKIGEELHFILNDKDKREFLHLVIPPNILNQMVQILISINILMVFINIRITFIENGYPQGSIPTNS